MLTPSGVHALAHRLLVKMQACQVAGVLQRSRVLACRAVAPCVPSSGLEVTGLGKTGRHALVIRVEFEELPQQNLPAP